MYTRIYIYVLLLWLFLLIILGKKRPFISLWNDKIAQRLTALIVVVLLFLIGFRPVSVEFGDMGVYQSYYDKYQNGDAVGVNKDVLWYQFMWLMAQLFSSQIFFLFISILYFLFSLKGVQRLYGKYYGMPVGFVIFSFSFFSYGTNGIRAGLATALAVSCVVHKNDTFWRNIPGLIIAVMIHQSTLLIGLGYLLAKLIRGINIFYLIWLFSIFIPDLLRIIFNPFIRGGSYTDRLEKYKSIVNTDILDTFSVSGYRWDFLLYSSVPVILSVFYMKVVDQCRNDLGYVRALKVFLFSNAFWVLNNDMAFSNRLAYVSWAIMPLLLVYPFVTKIFTRFQSPKFALLSFAYFGFTIYLLF